MRRSEGTVEQFEQPSPMIAVPPCSLQGSSSLIASRRSMILLPVFRKKKIATSFKALAATGDQRVEDHCCPMAQYISLKPRRVKGKTRKLQIWHNTRKKKTPKELSQCISYVKWTLMTRFASRWIWRY